VPEDTLPADGFREAPIALAVATVNHGNCQVQSGEFILGRNEVAADSREAIARESKVDLINIDQLLQLNAENYGSRPYFLQGSQFSKQMYMFVAESLAKHTASTISNSSPDSTH
jgi:hypothetical protein